MLGQKADQMNSNTLYNSILLSELRMNIFRTFHCTYVTRSLLPHTYYILASSDIDAVYRQVEDAMFGQTVTNFNTWILMG